MAPLNLSCDSGSNITPSRFSTSISTSVALLVLSQDKKIPDDQIIFEEIEKMNKNSTKIEKIKKFFVINKKLSIENGMMTPTLKLKRYKIIKQYKSDFEKLYK